MAEDRAMPQAYYSELEFNLSTAWINTQKVQNSGHFLEVCCLFWIEIFNNFFVVQTSNSTDIPSVGEDLGYCALVEQIIKRVFFNAYFV